METQAATLRLAVFPRPSLLTDALLVCGGAALVALCAQISFHLGFTPVPITGQTFAVCSSAPSLGSVRGTASLLLYLLIGLAGAPGLRRAQARLGRRQRLDRRLHRRLRRRGGADRLPRRARLGPALLVVGLGDAHRQRRHLRLRPALAPPLARPRTTSARAGRRRSSDGLYPFVPGDIVKLYLAALALPGAWKLVGRLKS